MSRVRLWIRLPGESNANAEMIRGSCGLRGLKKQSRRGRNSVRGTQFEFGASVKSNQAQRGGAKPTRFHFRRNRRVKRDDWLGVGNCGDYFGRLKRLRTNRGNFVRGAQSEKCLRETLCALHIKTSRER